MITDKEILDAPYMPSALLRDIRNRKNGHWSWSNKKALDKIYERDRFIRREAAEQARKEAAAERLAKIDVLDEVRDNAERGHVLAYIEKRIDELKEPTE